MKLNRQQEMAVRHSGGPILVLAGAGSGKTRIIVNRIHSLVTLSRVPEWQILAITFTNKAANEMRERIAAMPDIIEPGKLTIGTFHSICARILRVEHRRLLFNANFSIVDEAEQVSRLKKAIQQSGYNSNVFTVKVLISLISQAKNRFETPDSMLEKHGVNPFYQGVSDIYKIYQKGLQTDQSLDFDDLIVRTVRLFKDEPDVLEKYQNKFRYILIDEYQDTNNAQYELVRLLGSRYRNIMAVGDDDQSIYRWRGAEISNILNFPNDFPGTKIIKLEQNYRSTQTILSAASALLTHNKLRTPKVLWTDKSHGELITCGIWLDDRAEAEAICDLIKHTIAKNATSYNDFAIFFRINMQARILEEAFRKNRIPYKLVGNTSFFSRKEVKDLLAYIRLVLNPHDSGACRRILNVPRRGIGKITVDLLEKTALEKECSFYLAIDHVITQKLLSNAKTQILETFKELIEKLIRYAAQHNAVEFVDYLLQESSYSAQFDQDISAEAVASLEIIEGFKNTVADYLHRSDGKLAGFADFLSLYSDDEDTKPMEKDYVQLMTLHSAKGLEFPIVFISGLEEDLFPLVRDEVDIDPAALEEERRLLYVGMTRAKQKLYLFCAAQRGLYGKIRRQTPSRFLEEIPNEYKTAISNTSKTPFVKRLGGPSPSNTFNPGERIRHPSLGSGTVVDCSGSGPKARITIDFDRVGRKKLIVSLANLIRLH
ncbi:MAG: UvrD-helicase domain-containing protein [bacterium]